MTRTIELDEIRPVVAEAVEAASILDIHTHLYAPAFGKLLLWGVDELLTYHYLVAEVFRAAPLPYDRFWRMSKSEQADYIWQHLFIERSPVSEACRGVLTVLAELGLDVQSRDLAAFRRYFASLSLDRYLEVVFQHAHVRSVIMTNDPFDEQERAIWENGWRVDSCFQPALRLDPLLTQWSETAPRLAGVGGLGVQGPRRFG